MDLNSDQSTLFSLSCSSFVCSHPTNTTLPTMQCVLDIGIPSLLASKTVAAELLSTVKPLKGDNNNCIKLLIIFVLLLCLRGRCNFRDIFPNGIVHPPSKHPQTDTHSKSTVEKQQDGRLRFLKHRPVSVNHPDCYQWTNCVTIYNWMTSALCEYSQHVNLPDVVAAMGEATENRCERLKKVKKLVDVCVAFILLILDDGSIN